MATEQRPLPSLSHVRAAPPVHASRRCPRGPRRGARQPQGSLARSRAKAATVSHRRGILTRGVLVPPSPGHNCALPHPGHRRTSVTVTTRAREEPPAQGNRSKHTAHHGRAWPTPTGRHLPSSASPGARPGWQGPRGLVHTLRLYTLEGMLRRASQRRRRPAAGLCTQVPAVPRLPGLGLLPRPLLPGQLLGPHPDWATWPGDESQWARPTADPRAQSHVSGPEPWLGGTALGPADPRPAPVASLPR